MERTGYFRETVPKSGHELSSQVWRMAMEGLLQAAVAVCACKVGFGILCIPALRSSLSSVGLCCGCLLLLTDFAVTLFLVVLWLAGPWLLPSAVSTDRIALRFLLFLTHTYGHVMLLFVPLVAMEMVFQRHKPLQRGVEGGGNGGMELLTRKGEDGGKDLHTKGGDDGAPLCPEKRETEGRETSPEQAPPTVPSEPQRWDASTAGTLAHVVCVLSCLLAWCVSGLHALHSGDLDGATVELCLEEGTGGGGSGGGGGAGSGGSGGGGGGGSEGSLWRCLPSLLSSTTAAVWPDFSKSCWGLPVAAAVLLELYGSLRLIHVLAASGDVACPERATSSPEEEEEEEEGAGVQGILFTSGNAAYPERATPSPEEEEEVEEEGTGVRGILAASDVVSCPERATSSPEEEEGAGVQGILSASDFISCSETATPSPREEKERAVVQVPRQTAHVGPGSLTLLYEDQTADTDVRGQTQTQHTLLRVTVNPTVGVTTQSPFVDTETTGDRCCVLSALVCQGGERHRPPRLIDGQRRLSSRRCVPSEWSLSGDGRSGRQMQNKRPSVPAQRLQQSVPEMRYESTMTHPDSGNQIDPRQLCSQSWAFPGESPGPRGPVLIVWGLVWGMFVGLFPAALGFSVLLLRHTETLLLFGLKVLTRPPSQDKHTEST